jgi:hypothetical protein
LKGCEQKVNFKIEKSKNIVKGTLRYLAYEHSFNFEPMQTSSYSVMVGYIDISFDWKMQARQIGGFSPFEAWNIAQLFPPFSITIKGKLTIAEKIESIERISGSENWKTYFDMHNCWLCLGNRFTNNDDCSVEFATNIITVLNSNNELKSLWFKPMFP